MQLKKYMLGAAAASLAVAPAYAAPTSVRASSVAIDSEQLGEDAAVVGIDFGNFGGHGVQPSKARRECGCLRELCMAGLRLATYDLPP